MSTTVIRRPAEYAAAAAPVLYTLNTTEHILTGGNITIYQLVMRGLPPDGAGFRIGAYRWVFRTTGADPNNPFQIDISGLSTDSEVATAVSLALQNNAWLMDGLYPGNPMPNAGTGTLLAMSYPEPRSPEDFEVFDPSGTPYTNPPNDPLYANLMAGNPAELREQFAVYLQMEMEADFRQNTDWQRLPVLRLPVDAEEIQRLDFRVDRLLQSQLGFDVPMPDSPLLQPALRAFRRARARYWTAWFEQEGGQIQHDEFNGTRYEFHVLNASTDEYTALPHHTTLDNCETNSVVVPEPLAPYFRATSNAPQAWLSSASEQHIPPHATGYLSFYANPVTPDFAAPTDFVLHVAVQAGDQTQTLAIELFNSDLLKCEPEIELVGQIWTVPLQRIWTAIADAGIAIDTVASFCVELQNNPMAPSANLITAGENGTFDGHANGWSFVGPTPTVAPVAMPVAVRSIITPTCRRIH